MTKTSTQLQSGGALWPEADDDFRDLFEAASEMILVVSPTGDVIFANRQWRDALGYAVAELAGRTLFDLTPRSDHAACQDWLEHPPPPETARQVRLRFLARTGGEVPVEGLTTARHRGMRVIRFHGVFKDLTGREVEEALRREQAETLQAVTDYAPVGVFRANAEGRLTYTNGRWRHFAGLVHLDEPRGVWWQMVHPDDRAQVTVDWQQARLRQRELVSEFRVRGEGNLTRRVRTRLAPVQPAAGGQPFWIGISEDITAAWNAAERMRVAKAELELAVEERTKDLRATNRELGDFAYALTHDMKAPLRGIQRVTEWLVTDHADQLGPEGARLCGLLQDRVRFLNDFVEGMLRFTRVGRERVVEHDVPLGPVIERVRELLAPPAHIRWVFPATPPVVRGVSEYLHQVFQNLFDNAIKYLDKPVGLVELRARRVEHGWEFAVSDNGPGIPSRYQDKLFQPFQKLPASVGSPGAGIGLALVRRIVEGRGGRVSLESQEGQGTTVFIFWPDHARVPPRANPGAAGVAAVPSASSG